MNAQPLCINHKTKRDGKVMQNFFLFPAILSSMLFCFVFLVLFKTGYPFETTVLVTGFLIVLLWIGLFVRHQLKERDFFFTFKNILLIVCFIVSSSKIVAENYFAYVRNFDAMNSFLNGIAVPDPIFFAVLPESLITNGYPSILLNAPYYLSYHFFTDLMIAAVSKVLSVPCLITYYYIFPIITFPVFMYLIQKAIVVAKEFLEQKIQLYFIDYILIALFIAGLTTPIGGKYKLVLLFDTMLAASQSHHASITLVLLYLCIAHAGYKRIKQFDALNMYLLIPSFILLLSFCKVTTGFAFAAGISYYTFRKNLFKNRRWCLSFLYVLMFVLYYGFFTVMGGHAEYTVSAAESTRAKLIQFGLFKFVSSRTSWEPVIAVVGHYIIVLLPAVLVFLFERPKKIFHIWVKNISDKGAVCESIIVVNVVLIFPGFLLNTVGGDTYTYFEYCAVFSALLFMLAMRTPEKITAFASVCLHDKSKENYSRIFKLCTLCVYIVCCACVSIQLKNANLYSMVKQCCFSRLSYEDTLLANRIKKLCKVFHPSKFLADKNYIMLTEIRDYTKKNRDEYCVFLKDDYGLIKKYADYYSMYYPWYNPGFSYVIAYWSIPAYTGLPVINAMYFKDDVFFVGNDAEFGQIADSTDWGLPPRGCGDKVTEENMLQVAAKQNKKYVIVVGKDSFEVVPVK